VVRMLAEVEMAIVAPADWTTLIVPTRYGELRIVREMFAPGNRVASVVRGAYTAAKEGEEVVAGTRRVVLDWVLACKMLLGLRFDPIVAEDDERERAVYAIATATDGLVFDGLYFREPSSRGLVQVGPA